MASTIILNGKKQKEVEWSKPEVVENGFKGKGLKCDGRSYAESEKFSLSGVTGIKIDLYLKPDKLEEKKKQAIASIRKVFNLQINGNRLNFRTSSQDGKKKETVTFKLDDISQWLHVTAVYEAGQPLRLTVNEKSATSKGTADLTPQPESTRIIIGGESSAKGIDNGFAGIMDEIIISLERKSE